MLRWSSSNRFLENETNLLLLKNKQPFSCSMLPTSEELEQASMVGMFMDLKSKAQGGEKHVIYQLDKEEKIAEQELYSQLDTMTKCLENFASFKEQTLQEMSNVRESIGFLVSIVASKGVVKGLNEELKKGSNIQESKNESNDEEVKKGSNDAIEDNDTINNVIEGPLAVGEKVVLIKLRMGMSKRPKNLKLRMRLRKR